MRSTTNVDLILTSAERGHPTVIFETATNDAACREVLRRLARDLTRVVLPPRPKRGTKRTSLHGGSAIVQGDVWPTQAWTRRDQIAATIELHLRAMDAEMRGPAPVVTLTPAVNPSDIGRNW